MSHFYIQGKNINITVRWKWLIGYQFICMWLFLSSQVCVSQITYICTRLFLMSHTCAAGPNTQRSVVRWKGNVICRFSTQSFIFCILNRALYFYLIIYFSSIASAVFYLIYLHSQIILYQDAQGIEYFATRFIVNL